MTVASRGAMPGTLGRVVREEEKDGGEHDVEIFFRSFKIAANLQAGADIANTAELGSNSKLAPK